MTSDARGASKGITSEDAPACWLDWRIHECHPFLRLFDKELELRHPKLYAFIHKGWILHYSSGKRAIKSASSIPVVEGADATPRGLLSPRRLSVSTPPASSAPTSPPPKGHGKLTVAQDSEYAIMPALIEVLEGELAALVLARVTDEGGKDYLRSEAPSCGTQMLLLIETRGSAPADMALKLLRVTEIEDVTKAGASAPTRTAWDHFTKKLKETAEAAGGISDPDMLQRLTSAIYRFEPQELRLRMLSIVSGASSSASLKLRVSDYFDGEDTAAALKAQQDGPRVALAVATATNERLTARVKELEANGARPPPRARDPPTDVVLPPVKSKWDKERHRKCKNHPEKPECGSGEHFDRECPANPWATRGGKGKGGGKGSGKGGGRGGRGGRGDRRPAPLAAGAVEQVPAQEQAAIPPVTPPPPTAILMTVGQQPHAARDFSALFGTGSIQAVLMVSAAETSPPEVSRSPVLRSHPWPPSDHPPTLLFSSPRLPLTVQDHTACHVDPDVLAELRAAEHGSLPSESSLTHHPHQPTTAIHGPDSPPTPATDVCHDVDAQTSSMELISGWEAENSGLVLEVQAARQLAEAVRGSIEDDAMRSDAADRMLAAREQAAIIAGHGAKPLELEDLASALLCSAEEATSAGLSSDELTSKRPALDCPILDLPVESYRSPDHFFSPHPDTITAYADAVAASIREAADAAYSSSELDANCEMAIQASLHRPDAAAPSSSSPGSSSVTLSDAYDSDDDPFSCLAWPSWRQESEWARQVAEHRACTSAAAAAAAAAAVKASFSSGATFVWHRRGSRTAQGAARAIQTAYWTYRRRSSRARRERRAALRPIRVAAKKLRIATAAVAASLDSGAIFAWHRNGPGAPAHAVTIIQAALRLRMLRPVVVPSPEAPVAPALPPSRVPPHPRYSLAHPGDLQTQGTHILLVLAAHDAARTLQACQRARRPSASGSDADTSSMPALASDPPSDCDDGQQSPTHENEMSFSPCASVVPQWPSRASVVPQSLLHVAIRMQPPRRYSAPCACCSVCEEAATAAPSPAGAIRRRQC